MGTYQTRTEFVKTLFPSFAQSVKDATEATQRFADIIRELGVVGLTAKEIYIANKWRRGLHAIEVHRRKLRKKHKGLGKPSGR